MKAIKLPSGNYRVNAYCGKDPETRKEIRRSFTGPDKRRVMAEASAWIDEHRRVMSAQDYEGAQKAFLRARKASLSPSTLRGYEAVTVAIEKETPWLLRKNCYAIGTEDLQQLVSTWAGNGASAKTIKNRMGLVTAVLTFKGMGRPAVQLPQTQLPDLNIPDSVTVRRTLKAAKKDTELWICIMLAATGPLRRGEICALTIEDVDVKTNVIHVAHDMVYGADNEWHTRPPKTRSSDRYILMPALVIQAIKKQGYVTNWNPNQLYLRFRRLLKDAKIPAYRFHDLRHYCISELLAKGVEEIYIAERSGHSSLGTMARYKHILNAHRKDVNAQIMEQFKSLTG